MLIYAIINVHCQKLFVIKSKHFLWNAAQKAINIFVCHAPQIVFEHTELNKVSLLPFSFLWNSA
ncbi:hypothetical protein [Okeania sp. KiyG1]|uniref:hypothetical protein n=1 Tax=Okeania sp. KiyG1 TaxID=2720165 RepID=UPI00192440AD|nr:hypothetical protein [Okeania sp. KiyG1]